MSQKKQFLLDTMREEIHDCVSSGMTRMGALSLLKRRYVSPDGSITAEEFEAELDVQYENQ